MDKPRIIASMVMFAIMIVMIGYVTVNRERLFQRSATVIYADGCEEVYINENLTTPICVEGRRLEELRTKKYNTELDELWNQANLTAPNVTLS